MTIPLVAAALLLAGCTASPDTAAAPEATTETTPAASVETAPSAAAETAAPAEPVISERGNLVKTVGQYFGLESTDGSGSAADAYVTGITVDPTCTGASAQASENGHFVKVDLDITTFAGLNRPMMPNAANWKVIAADGTTFNGDVGTVSARLCLNDAEQVPDQVGPGEKVLGSVILDVPTTTGVLIYQDNPEASWEWAY